MSPCSPTGTAAETQSTKVKLGETCDATIVAHMPEAGSKASASFRAGNSWQFVPSKRQWELPRHGHCSCHSCPRKSFKPFPLPRSRCRGCKAAGHELPASSAEMEIPLPFRDSGVEVSSWLRVLTSAGDNDNIARQAPANALLEEVIGSGKKACGTPVDLSGPKARKILFSSPLAVKTRHQSNQEQCTCT